MENRREKFRIECYSFRCEVHKVVILPIILLNRLTWEILCSHFLSCFDFRLFHALLRQQCLNSSNYKEHNLIKPILCKSQSIKLSFNLTFKLIRMSSNQVELSFMLSKLKDMDSKIGGNQKKKRADSEFDFLQEQFLARRHKVQKYQDILEKQGGFNKSNANAGYQIRQGIIQMKELLDKLKQEHRRLTKKKKDTPQILQRKRKIVQNCQLLLKDIEDRESDGVAKNKTKTVTLTDLKAKLLHEIDQNNDAIHEKDDKEDKFNQNQAEDKQQIGKWKKKDEQIDVMVDGIIDGLKDLKGKVVKVNQAQDIINEKTKKADKKVGKLQTRIKGDNQKLKKIIQQFKPNRCCLYLALFLLLVGLVVCVIKLLI